MNAATGLRRYVTAAVLLAGAGLLAVSGASPALAAGSLNAPTGTVTSSSPFAVTGTGGTCGGSLTVTGPNGFSKTASTSSSGGSMSVSIDPATSSNGNYQAVLTTKTKPTIGSCTTDSSHPSQSFALAVAPDAPTGVDAELNGDRQITVSWNQNTEFDITKYLLYDASSGSTLTSVRADDSSFCSSSACSISVSYPESTYGQQSFQVAAVRPANGSSGSIVSDKSNTTSATLPPPPSPDPTQPPGGGGNGGGDGGGGTGDGGGGGGTGDGGNGGGNGGGGNGGAGGGGNGGSGGGGGDAALRALGGSAPSLTFSGSSGNVILPPAPPPALAAPGSLDPVVGAVPDGPYQETLPYGARAAASKTQHHNAASRVIHDVTDVVHGPSLVRSIAGALLLFLAGWHLRLWMRRPVI